MSAVGCVVQALLRDATITAIVDQRIRNIATEDEPPCIVVNLIYEGTDQMLDGPSKWYAARVSVECHSRSLPQVQVLAEAVKDVLEPIHLEIFNDCECSIRKDGSDVTDFTDEGGIARRIIDFAIDWRRQVPAL